MCEKLEGKAEKESCISWGKWETRSSENYRAGNVAKIGYGVSFWRSLA